jgi:hypothetical protein
MKKAHFDDATDPRPPRSRALLAALAALALAAIAAGAGACDGKGSKPNAGAGGGGAGPSESPGCFGTEWLVRLPTGGECPSPKSGNDGSWRWGKLFEPIPDGAPKQLGLYCYYEHKDDLPFVTAHLDELPLGPNGEPGTAWLECDSEVVAPMVDTAEVALAMADNLGESLRVALDVPLSLIANPQAPAVKIAIVDTWPTSKVTPTSSHGFGMGSLASNLTCGLFGPGGQCPIEIAPYLALNVVEPGQRDNQSGGYYGMRGRVARSLFDALTTLGPAHLVLNLSFGWDGIYNTTPSGNPSMATDAVRDVLEYAACEGALVVAAAGNASGGEIPEVGPLYPAAWEGVAPYCSDGSFVFAAGSVDAEDQRLPTARKDALPPHVVPSFAVPAVGKTSDSPQLQVLGPYTGTSVAAAITSAIAALRWHYDPNLSAEALIAAVRAAGTPLPSIVSDFGDASVGTPVRRLSLCKAVENLAVGVMCNPLAAGAGQNPAWDPLELDAVLMGVTTFYDGTVLTALDTTTTCSADVYVDASVGKFEGANACPFEQLPASALVPWVTPQPGIDPCGACALSLGNPADAVLELAVNNELTELAFAETLALWSGGTLLERYEIGSANEGATELRDGVSAGKVYKVVLSLDPVSAAAADMATIEWVPTSRDSQTTSQVIVMQ